MKNPVIALSWFFLIMLLLACEKENEGPTGQLDDIPDYDFPIGKVYFSHPPIPVEFINVLEPRGYLDPPASPHGGVHHVDFPKEQSDIPVLALADGLV
ncbi:MAG: hypothetical protein ACNS62_14095, partial [Candidatus Cyclobacteriaceae bacterium M3_2C_046]